jgi:inositol 2-dehydrogenase
MSVGIGLIGVGRMGQVFAQHLAQGIPGARLVAIADTNPDHVQEAARRFEVEGAYTDPRALLERGDVDAVLVVTPTSTHVEVVQAAARAGKHIFCEKPLALTVQGCDAAIAAVEQAGVKLQVGFMRHFDAAYLAAKKKIEEGVIGAPVMFKGISRDPSRTNLDYARREKSGGMLLDLAIHDFDLARWLMGSEIARVYTEGECLVYPELQEVGDIDNALVNLRFASGALGNVDVSRNAVYGYDIRTEVLGSKGSMIIGTLQHTPVLVLTRDGVMHDTIPYFMERYGEAYAAELRDFVACLREDRAPAVTGHDARAATAIAVAATRSLDEKRPVELSRVARIIGE